MIRRIKYNVAVNCPAKRRHPVNEQRSLTWRQTLPREGEDLPELSKHRFYLLTPALQCRCIPANTAALGLDT